MERGPRTTMKSGPHLPQLEKALAQKRGPNTASNQSINQSINEFKLKKKKLPSAVKQQTKKECLSQENRMELHAHSKQRLRHTSINAVFSKSKELR